MNNQLLSLHPVGTQILTESKHTVVVKESSAILC